MGKRNRHLPREYLNDFHPMADGGFIYTGVQLRWASAGLSRKRSLTGFGLLAVIQAVSVLVCGSIPAPGMLNYPWVILPYVASAASEFLLVWALIRLSLAGDSVREYIHKKTVGRFPVLTGACMVFCALSLAAEFLYLLLYGWGEHGIYAVLFLWGQAVQILCNVLWRSLYRRIRWQIQ